MYSKVARSHGLIFNRLKISSSNVSKVRGPKFASSNGLRVISKKYKSSHGTMDRSPKHNSSNGPKVKVPKHKTSYWSKDRGPKFVSRNVSVVRKPKDTSSCGSNVRSPEDARRQMSNDRYNNCDLDTETLSCESPTLFVQNSSPCTDSFKRILTDTTGTAFTDITGTASTDITGTASTDVTGTESTDYSRKESTDITWTLSTDITATESIDYTERESTDFTGKESTDIIDKVRPNKINETCTHTFQMEQNHHVANLVEQIIANLGTKQRTKDVTKDDKIKNVHKTDELSTCSTKNVDKEIVSFEDPLSFNQGPTADTGQAHRAKNSFANQISQIVFKLYYIDHVDHAHLKNPLYVNITDTIYCVIDEKTPNI